MSLQNPLRIAVACGGTGGHTFPGVATAQELVRRGHEVTLWVAGRDIEQQTLKGWEGPLFKTGARQLRLRPAALAALGRSLRRASRGLRQQRSEVVLAMGSYASLAPVLAAHWQRVPVVLHEANAIPGKAIDKLARYATAVAISFEASAAALRHDRIVTTGLPLRLELLQQPPLAGLREPNGFTILVTGGSQGAQVLNRICSEALARLSQMPAIPHLRVIHQTGAAGSEAVRARYTAAGVDALVTPFIAAMGGAFKAADLVIARAGAATCAELALFGCPALLVPLPTALRDHQRANAAQLHAAGAADLCLQADFTVEFLVDYLQRLLPDKARRDAMREAALGLAEPQAVTQLAELVERVARHESDDR